MNRELDPRDRIGRRDQKDDVGEAYREQILDPSCGDVQVFLSVEMHLNRALDVLGIPANGETVLIEHRQFVSEFWYPAAGLAGRIAPDGIPHVGVLATTRRVSFSPSPPIQKGG